jgi:hypothetical protein
VAATKKKAIIETSAAGRLLEDYLRTQPVGTVATYADLSRVAVVDDVRKCRGVLLSAVKRLNKKDRIHWECVKDVGYKRMDDEGKFHAAVAREKKGKRALSRGLTVILTIDEGGLPDELRPKLHGASNRIVFALAAVSSRSKRLESTAPEEFSARKALGAVLKALPKK